MMTMNSLLVLWPPTSCRGVRILVVHWLPLPARAQHRQHGKAGIGIQFSDHRPSLTMNGQPRGPRGRLFRDCLVGLVDPVLLGL